MRYPKPLPQGGKIGFIAPSFGCAMEPYKSYFTSALQKFQSLGYETILGPNCYADCGIGKSNTPEKCAEEINEFFTQTPCDIIISCGGGETMCEDLPYVDFEAIAKAEPKWYTGYSDNTNLTFTLPTLCDTAAIYGPCVKPFGAQPWHESIQDAFDLLTDKKLTFHNYPLWEKEEAENPSPLQGYNATEPFSMQIHGAKNAAFSGRLLGGCLDCLAVLCGTQFDKVREFNLKYQQDGIIWFLEACDLKPMNVHRALWQLDQAGWFENAKGFLIGRPLQMDGDDPFYDHISAVTSVLEKYQVPILLDVDLGHLPPMMPLVSGALARVEAKDNELTITHSFSR